MANEDPKKTNEEEDFGYMVELSKAYQEAFSKRIAGKKNPLSEEKRALLATMQGELSRTGGKVALALREEEKKELARMLKESAEEFLRALAWEEEPDFTPDPYVLKPLPFLLARATLLANRSLNLLIRHGECDDKLFRLVTSELSALYAIAALN